MRRVAHLRVNLVQPTMKYGVLLDKDRKHVNELITLFTSMKDSDDRRQIHHRMLVNWASLESYNWTHMARSLGWTVRNVPKQIHKLPVLKHMFRDAIEADTKTPFYGYANSDILFDSSLVETLQTLRTTGKNLKSPFVVGRRTNVNVTQITGNVSDDRYLRSLRKVGSLFQTTAQDYFITTATGFPWEKVPEFVIGRTGYYTWRVTDSLCANLLMAGHVEYHTGNTFCIPRFTVRNITSGCVQLRRREIPKYCLVNRKMDHGRCNTG